MVHIFVTEIASQLNYLFQNSLLLNSLIVRMNQTLVHQSVGTKRVYTITAITI